MKMTYEKQNHILKNMFLFLKNLRCHSKPRHYFLFFFFLNVKINNDNDTVTFAVFAEPE